MKRIVIAHAHIFKNAGTTVDWILEKNLAKKFVDDRNDSLMLNEPSYLSNLITGQGELLAFSSHSLPLPLPAEGIKGVDIELLFMLRHPLLRVRSVYNFERKQKADTPGAKFAKKATFSEYIEWRMQANVNATIRNMQVSYLTRKLFLGSTVTQEHLENAKSLVCKTPLVGIVEQFDESMIVFDHYLRSLGLELGFEYVKQNITDKTSESHADKLQRLESELGSDLYSQLVENNKYDLALYDFAVKEVSNRFESISNNQEKLSDFTVACKRLDGIKN